MTKKVTTPINNPFQFISLFLSYSVIKQIKAVQLCSRTAFYIFSQTAFIIFVLLLEPELLLPEFQLVVLFQNLEKRHSDQSLLHH